eukprot:GHVT01061168.1.p1 GENE.GHVT01061168.1~~GHVT01061168.1.p1  ORF type:complete len:133 (+),score=0.75 GHVT01061168.1:2093-2491(+)
MTRSLWSVHTPESCWCSHLIANIGKRGDSPATHRLTPQKQRVVFFEAGWCHEMGHVGEETELVWKFPKPKPRDGFLLVALSSTSAGVRMSDLEDMNKSGWGTKHILVLVEFSTGFTVSYGQSSSCFSAPMCW